jgi:hypothetical protein
MHLVRASAYVVLQFDKASITTIGILVGMHVPRSPGAQQFILVAGRGLAALALAIFGVLFFAAGILCFINPKNTFAGLADILGVPVLHRRVWWSSGRSSSARSPRCGGSG